MREKLLYVLAHTEAHQKLIQSALDYVRKVTGTSSNACAATASTFLRTAGIFDEIYLTTGQVSNGLKRLLCTKITDPSKLIIGDVCFTKDLKPLNGFPDHTFIIATDKYGTPPKYSMYIVDNYYTYIHKRNLLGGPNTDFEYAYRLPQDTSPDINVDKVRSHAVSDLGDIYDHLKEMNLPEGEETYILQRLNEIRFSKTLKDYKREE